MSGNEQKDNKVLCIISYLGILWIIGLLTAKEDPNVKFHANQGIILSLYFLAVSIITPIPVLGWFIVGPIGFIFGLVMIIMGIINANKGEQKDLPLIGKIRILK